MRWNKIEQVKYKKKKEKTNKKEKTKNKMPNSYTHSNNICRHMYICCMCMYYKKKKKISLAAGCKTFSYYFFLSMIILCDYKLLPNSLTYLKTRVHRSLNYLHKTVRDSVFS